MKWIKEINKYCKRTKMSEYAHSQQPVYIDSNTVGYAKFEKYKLDIEKRFGYVPIDLDPIECISDIPFNDCRQGISNYSLFPLAISDMHNYRDSIYNNFHPDYDVRMIDIPYSKTFYQSAIMNNDRYYEFTMNTKNNYNYIL